MSKFISFIIPSIGRKTLSDTLQSLMRMNSDDWVAKIIFDGVERKSIDTLKDQRIEEFYINKIEKKGINHAGNVRNFGVKKVQDSEWIGFVDDDDTIGPNYIENLKSETKNNPTADCVIFRAYYSFWNTILPQSSCKHILPRSVGISFAVKKHVFNKHKFIPSGEEDYSFLKSVSREFNILLSPYLNYFVRSSPFDDKYFKERTRVLNPSFK